MNEPERDPLLVLRGVDRVDAGAHVDEDAERDAHRELTTAGDELRERAALDVVHHEEELAIDLLHVVDADDVRMPDGRGEARLLENELPSARVLEQVGVHSLDRDGPGEAARAALDTDVDGAHAALRDAA